MKITFTGDVSFSQYFADGYKNENLFSPEIKAFFDESDHNIFNVECAVTDAGVTADKPLVHSSSPECAGVLYNAGADIWNISNNHILDCGNEGYFDTVRHANDCGAKVIGVGKNISEAEVPFFMDDAKVGIVSLCYMKVYAADEDKPGCVYWKDEDRIKKMIQCVKDRGYICIIIVHAGDEFSKLPMPDVRSRYISYVKGGADCVIAHHPHLAENYENVNGKMIFYSLGNLVFDTAYQRAQKETEYGALVRFDITDGKINGFDTLSYKINRISHTVKKCDKYDIFTEITEEEYKSLWKYSARNLFFCRIKKNVFLHPELAQKSVFSRLKAVVKDLKSHSRMIVVKGAVLSYLPDFSKKTKKAKKLKKYLKTTY